MCVRSFFSVKNAEKGGTMRARKAQTATSLGIGTETPRAVGFIARSKCALKRYGQQPNTATQSYISRFCLKGPVRKTVSLWSACRDGCFGSQVKPYLVQLLPVNTCQPLVQLVINLPLRIERCERQKAKFFVRCFLTRWRKPHILSPRRLLQSR